jgi:polyisoprenyl-teichoic acid--peptidoglycan teichoic acid transferase
MRRRALIVVLGLASWIAGTALGAITTVAPARAQTDPAVVLGRAHAGYIPALRGDRTVSILVIGSGARPGEDVINSLADSLHVVLLNPAKKAATVVGIPRDSYVSVPGGGSTKINSSMVQGGPELLVQTIEAAWGVRIDYWALTTFWGLPAMIQNVGGLTIDIPFSMHDSFSLSNFEPGRQKLTGGEVLAFSRDRHSLRQGDFGRQENGGRVILAAMNQFQKEYRADPSRMFTWIAGGMRNIDTDLPLAEVLDLAFTVATIRPGPVRNVVLAGSIGSVGGLSVVNVDTTRARALFDDAEADGALTKANVPPSPTAGE